MTSKILKHMQVNVIVRKKNNRDKVRGKASIENVCCDVFYSCYTKKISSSHLDLRFPAADTQRLSK